MKINFHNDSVKPIPTAKYTCSGCHFIGYTRCPGTVTRWTCRFEVLVKCEKSDIFNL